MTTSQVGCHRRIFMTTSQDGITSIPNSEIFEQLALMGYHTDSDKLTFQKGAFSPQWRFLIHCILHCISPKKTAWEQFSSNIATDICLDMQRHQLQQHTRTYHVPSLSMKVFNNMKRPTKGYSGQEVALFPTMIDVTAPSTSPSRITSSPSHSPEHSPSPTPSPSPEPTPAHTTADVTQPSPTQPSPTQPSPTQPSPTQPSPTQPSPTQPGTSLIWNTAGGTITYSRRSSEKRSRQDKGKAIMIESEPRKSTKKELEQKVDEEERKDSMDEAKSTKKLDWNDLHYLDIIL
ncbi:hypothetical protein Tco_0935613 [Tanacetum coccineum]